MIKETKSAVVSARLYESTKKKLAATGYTAADAIEWFVHEYYSSKTAKKLKMRREILEQNLESLEKDNEEIMKQIHEIKLELSELDTQDTTQNDTSDDNSDVNMEECLHLPSLVIEGITIVHNAYHRKKDRDALNNIDDFMDTNKEFMTTIWGKHAKKMDFEEFKELVRERVDEHVYNESKHLRRTS